MGKFIDMTGWIMKDHGVPNSRLTIIERIEDRIHPNRKHSTMWKCLCDCGNTIEAPGTDIRNGHTVSCGCRKNEKHPLLNQDDFLTKIYTLRDDVEIIGEYNGYYQKIQYKCLRCGSISEATPRELYRCRICSNCKNINHRLTNDEFVSRMSNIHPYIIVLSEYETQNTRIRCQCSICGHIWSPQARSLLNKEGCPRCRRSKGENKIEQFLIDKSIMFKPQKTYNDLVGVGNGLLSYDFYLPDYNLLIEYQGQFHDGTASQQSKEEFDIQQKHDKLKKEYAKNHNVNLLEIWYWDFDNIEHILNEKLNINNTK